MRITELPKDLLEEILYRVPATSLKRSRWTCKLWNRIFNDESFARKHCDKAIKECLFLMLTNKLRISAISVNLHHGTTPSVEFKCERTLFDLHFSNNSAKVDIYRVFHCDGLLLCTLSDVSRIVVWNPITGETKWITVDEYYERDRTFILGYYQDNKSFNSKSYKIFMSFSPGSHDSEIYEFNSDSWRTHDEDIPSRWFIEDCGQSVSLKGNTYWFSVGQTTTHFFLSFFRFDFSTEKFGEVSLPYEYDQPFTYKNTNLSVVREEKLAVLLQREINTKTEIWVTNKTDDETKVVVSWSKVLALDLSSDSQISVYGSFLLDEEKKVIVCCDRWINYMYMVMEEEMTDGFDKIYIVGEDSKVTEEDFRAVPYKMIRAWPSFLNYAPSLVQIQRPGGKRKRSD